MIHRIYWGDKVPVVKKAFVGCLVSGHMYARLLIVGHVSLFPKGDPRAEVPPYLFITECDRYIDSKVSTFVPEEEIEEHLEKELILRNVDTAPEA